MFKLLQIVWVAGLFCLLPAQVNSDNFQLAYPDYVLQGSQFQVSLITSNEFENADKLDLYIIPHHGLTVNNITVRTEQGEKEIPFANASAEGYLYDAVMSDIFFDGSDLIGDGSFFQILINFNSDRIESSEIEFYGEFIKDGNVIDYLYTSDYHLQGDYPNHYIAPVNFYKKNYASGNSLLLKQNSYFEIQPQLDVKNDLLLNYWIKFNGPNSEFLKIIDSQTNLTQFTLLQNEFHITTAESEFNNQTLLHPQFVPVNVWRNCSIVFSKEKRTAEFYCNGKIFARFEWLPSVSTKNLIFKFENANKSDFQLDQIRFIDLNENLNVCEDNSRFQSFVSDSSKLKVQFGFNESDINKLVQNQIISFNNVLLTNSDAPIFLRAPGLNINVLANYYELEWSGGDFKNAKYYIVERSKGGGDFSELSKINADNEKDKAYTYLSERIDDAGIVNFRIKQLNTDGSVIYSPQVKVGQGKTEEFIINQNYPNPFNPSTQISVELLEDTDLEIIVYNLEGKTIAVLQKGSLSKGLHQFTFDGSDLPSGIYLYKVSSPHFSQTKKMILAK